MTAGTPARRNDAVAIHCVRPQALHMLQLPPLPDISRIAPMVMLAVSGCVTAGHDVAEQGRRVMLGMDATTVQSCAGIPSRIKKVDEHTEIFSYEITNQSRGGLELTIPVIGGGAKVGASGAYCHAILRVVDGRVADINYTGDNDDVAGREGVCAPLVRGCLRAWQRGDPEVREAARYDPEGKRQALRK